MRIGTTSYIYPADIITNVRKLAGRVSDIEVLIFELDDRWNNLPDARIVREMAAVASANGMTYTVHLPLDLRLAADDNEESVEKALRVINATLGLSPVGFVIHLEGESREPCHNTTKWIENSAASLEILGREAGDFGRLCVENLENHSPDMIDGLLERLEVSCCVDVGHLWKEGLDPAPLLARWLPRAPVVHIHGIAGRDHKSLSVMSPAQLDPVVRVLGTDFQGIVTLEVFSEEDFVTSRQALDESLGRSQIR